MKKKTRFEVFKRDNFKCQYCGRESPDVILEVDHINPSSKGGPDDIFNLITSCFDCNRGKSDIKLSNKSEIKKQKEELKKLNKRREQLELLLKWREELLDINDKEVDGIEKIFNLKTGTVFTDKGRNDIKKLIKKYGLKEVLESTDISLSQYYDENDDYNLKCFKSISNICKSRKLQKEKPHMKELYYIRGILRNRLSYINEYETIKELEKAFNNGCSLEYLKDLSLNVEDWSYFINEIENYVED